MDTSIIFGALLGAAMIGFLLLIRVKDIPRPAPPSPFQYLEERKASIYENLRDLQFEYRLDKLSDDDYHQTKLELQKDLARVMAETDKLKATLAAGGKLPAPEVVATKPAPSKKKNVCLSCGAEFEKALKFCGECGKPMGGVA